MGVHFSFIGVLVLSVQVYFLFGIHFHLQIILSFGLHFLFGDAIFIYTTLVLVHICAAVHDLLASFSDG